MTTVAPDWLWAFFVVSVLVALFVDFVVLKKQGAHEVTVPEAIRWSAIWVALSLAFNVLLWWAFAQDQGSAVATRRPWSSSPATSSRSRWRWTTSSSS
jgi:tellurite resistance protein TerC